LPPISASQFVRFYDVSCTTKSIPEVDFTLNEFERFDLSKSTGRGDTAMSQKRKYNPARGGHAPGHLRDGLLMALRKAWDTSREEAWWDYLDMTFFDPILMNLWNTWTPKQRGIWLIGQLWNCRDVLPGSVCALASLSQGSTYAQFVRHLRNEINASSGCSVVDFDKTTDTPA
jgi:hypothetical protein